MPQIKPVSDLRNYNEVLSKVVEGNPVYLTKNGHGRYAIYEIDDVKRREAEIQLLHELARGEISARDAGWLDEDAVDQELENANW